MPPPEAERRLAAIAAKQHNTFSRTQALAAGFTRDGIRNQLKSGRWVHESRSVYALAGAPVTWERRLHAALLACGPTAAASGATAAFLLGFRAKRPPIIDVSVRRPVCGPRLPGVRVHRVRDVEASTRDGVRLTTVRRTILDLAHSAELVAVFDAAIDKRKITVGSMRAYIGSLRTNPGLRRLRTLLEDRENGRLTTELERRFDELLKSSPLPYPARQYAIGTRSADFAYVEKQIVIELDGGDSHMRKDVFEDDRARQNELVLNGWTILRFTWDDVTKRSAYVVRTIDRMLSTKGARGRRP